MKNTALQLGVNSTADTLLYQLASQSVRHELGGPGGSAGVELVGVPDHLDLIGVREPRERALEPPLPDVAPRADHVGPDVDAHDRPTERGAGLFRADHVTRRAASP